jgi:predicted GIY-YIG superfamily endonuclease
MSHCVAIRSTAGAMPARTSRIFKAGKILYVEPHPDRASAAKREVQIKKWSRAKKMALIEGDIEELKRLAKRRHP